MQREADRAEVVEFVESLPLPGDFSGISLTDA